MANSIKVRVELDAGIAEVKSLIVHPMETGAREDPETGHLVPRHHITQIRFANNGEPVLTVNSGTAVARNPYFNFRFKGASPGDRFRVEWTDNRGESDSLETTID